LVNVFPTQSFHSLELSPTCRHGQGCVDETSFVAVDVETANANLSSICQIAAVSFVAGRVVHVWQSLVNPEEPFAPLNVSLHGIDRTATQNAPPFPMVAPALCSLITDKVVASHMAFDKVALQRVYLKYCLPPVVCTWLDTARVSRRAWPRFARRGYGLKSIASWCGIEFQHHNALEDARVAGALLLRAISDTGVSVDDWISRTGARSHRELPSIDSHMTESNAEQPH
jgi:DNA polymerase-3 subunit epsilon